MIVDTHAHYEDHAFDEDRDELLSGMPEEGIYRIVDVAATMNGCKKALAIAKEYPYVYCSLGVHPSETEPLTDEFLDWMLESSVDEKVVAIGEIGLDYHWPEPAKEIQKKWFEKQLLLARKANLPVIIHSREAAEDTLAIMKEKAEGLSGIIHCFSYSPEMAKTYVDMGFYIGVGGVLTFKNAKKLKRVVTEIPLERIVLETDCPYMCPEPYRGKRNDSSMLPYVVEMLANLRGIDKEEVLSVTQQNAFTVYKKMK